MKRRAVAAFCGILMLSACSQNSSSPGLQTFCELAEKMDQTSSGSHGEDPAAITDPDLMRETWQSITALADQMKAQSPTAVASDLDLMLSTLYAMDEIFAANDYDLTAMAVNPETRATVDALTQDPALPEASRRFNEFMEKNCDVS